MFSELVRQSQIVQSVLYSYDAVISSHVTAAIHSWFGIESARDFDDKTEVSMFDVSIFILSLRISNSLL